MQCYNCGYEYWSFVTYEKRIIPKNIIFLSIFVVILPDFHNVVLTSHYKSRRQKSQEKIHRRDVHFGLY